MCLYLFLFKCYDIFCLFFFNAVAASTFVSYKHEVCLVTIIKTSVLLYMPFLKWVFLCLPRGIIESTFGLCILYGFLALLFWELFCSWLLSVLKFIQCGWDKINLALYFVIKQTLCCYGVQGALIRGLRTVPKEGFRAKLSTINIPRHWRNGAHVFWGESGKHTTAWITTLLLFFWERENGETHIVDLKLPFLQFERRLKKGAKKWYKMPHGSNQYIR